MSLQPSSAEEHPETAVEAWKKRFLTELQTSQPLFIFLNFFANRKYISFYYYLKMIEQSTGHVQVKIYIVFSMYASFLCGQCLCLHQTMLLAFNQLTTVHG